MAADISPTGLLDLEKELTCSICTEILYQPLTLLDCLHTFCGSCLKEWFSFEATRATPAKPWPFNCPSCRVTVRDTKPNATVTTLLEMYLQANPSKARTDTEKEELKARYKPGENVIPKVEVREETRDEAQDRRMVEEALQMSLRDAGIRNAPTYERGVRHRPREQHRGPRAGSPPQRVTESQRNSTDARERARQIEHQSSLRSLLSNSDVDSSEIEEEILRQIMEDGILDGIDLNSLDVSQEDELSERIADAYRRRHTHRTRVRDAEAESRSRRRSARQPSASEERQAHGEHGRSPRRLRPEGNTSHPPLSRPHLLEAYPTAPTTHRRRTSSETRSQTSPSLSPNSRASSDTQRPAARSATDLTNRSQASPRISQDRNEVNSGHRRRTTEPDRSRLPTQAPEQTSSQPEIGAANRTRNEFSSGVDSNRHLTAERAASSSNSNNLQSAEPVNRVSTSQVNPERPRRPQTSSDHSESLKEPVRLYTEPLISCNRCGRTDLQHDLHYHCHTCSDGNYDICLRCYRLGRGCLHWFGFGKGASLRYERHLSLSLSPEALSPPHRLKGRQYLRPPQGSHAPSSNQAPPVTTSSDPASRLQAGPFCSNCLSFAADCFWKCDVCNEGEWGFCNACVGQARCCTHPLLPVALVSHLSTNTQPQALDVHHSRVASTFEPPAVPFGSVTQALKGHDSLFAGGDYVSLSVSTKCNVCTYPIPPSTTRFHCSRCSDGDLDMHTGCYLALLNKGTIREDDGPNGWRRCPKRHRMSVVGFEDTPLGQRRVVEKDLVGGHVLDDKDKTAVQEGEPEWKWQDEGQQRRRAVKSATASALSLQNTNSSPSTPLDVQGPRPTLLKTYPPDGGSGMHAQAMWSYWPSESAPDELAFPRGAEIRECEDINDDWYWGVYCGRKGLFPGNFVHVLQTI